MRQRPKSTVAWTCARLDTLVSLPAVRPGTFSLRHCATPALLARRPSLQLYPDRQRRPSGFIKAWFTLVQYLTSTSDITSNICVQAHPPCDERNSRRRRHTTAAGRSSGVVGPQTHRAAKGVRPAGRGRPAQSWFRYRDLRLIDFSSSSSSSSYSAFTSLSIY